MAAPGARATERKRRTSARAGARLGTFRAVASIARHETRRLTSFADPKTRWALLAAAVLLAASWPVVREHSIESESGLYPVALAPDAVLEAAVLGDDRFRIVDGDLADLETGRIALWIADEVAYAPDEPRSRAALAALRQATSVWLESQLALEQDDAAAFPVIVTVAYQGRELTGPAPKGAPPEPEQPIDATPGPDASQPPVAPLQPGAPGAEAPRAQPDLLQSSPDAVPAEQGVRPADVDIPFPVASLLLTFAFLIPMNFIGQLCAGNLLSDRIRHRGVIALSSPVPLVWILAGRTAPYLAMSLTVVVAAGLIIGVDWIGAIAAATIVLFVLAASILLGLLSRSERELTFLLTGITTMFSTFLFVPALFGALPPVAYLSPVTVVAASLRGEAVAWAPFLYAVLPTFLCTVTFALIAGALYREETLFSQRGLAAKTGQALARLVRAPAGLIVAGILAVPFAMALELFVLALVIPLGLAAAFPVFIVGVAAVEEALKLAPAASHLHRPQHKSRWLVGAAVGLGFFLGEKLALLVALSGFGELDLGTSTLALYGVGGSLLILVLPLLLHVLTGTISASGAARGKAVVWAAYLGAVVVHATYNVAIIAGALR